MPKIRNARTTVLDKVTKFSFDDPVGMIHNYNLDLKNNHIYLLGEEAYAHPDEGGAEPGVEFVIANRFIRNLNICIRQNPKVPILVHMKTCGGDWNEGMAIYNAIRSSPNPVTILNYTHARSMSSLIFQAANKRAMIPDSYFLFHRGTLALSGEYLTDRSGMRHSERENERMLQVYINAIKNSPHSPLSKWSDLKIKKWLTHQMDKKADVYLTPEEAIEYGLADCIFGADDHWDWKSLVKYSEIEKKK